MVKSINYRVQLSGDFKAEQIVRARKSNKSEASKHY